VVKLEIGKKYILKSLSPEDGWNGKGLEGKTFRYDGHEFLQFEEDATRCYVLTNFPGFEAEELPPPEAEAATMEERDFLTSQELKCFDNLTAGVKSQLRLFESGAKRDSSDGKPRPDLISPYMLEALGKVLAEGAKHYGSRNWEKGMPNEVLKESAARHYVSWMMDKDDEDHAAKLIFNVMAWIHFRDKPNN